jgi:diguanylate cyclase (GGDEF)-like protein
MRSEELESLGPISLDIEREVSAIGAAIRGQRTVSLPDAARSDFVSRRLVEAAQVGSAALVPLFDRGAPVGAIALLWDRVGERLAASASQVVDLVAAEAGPILNRLRDRDRLNVEAETDALTGLANRRTFSRALDQSQAGDALVMIDLDRFKRVNDEHGHAAGDDTLRTMGACLRQVARDGDCIARFGGEEFSVILPAADGDGARAFLTRLRELWDAAHPLTTFSAGYATRGQGEGSLFTLGRADRALYDAKRYGRNTDVEADPAESDVA